ncbi:hypothetical protein JR316_0007345 [Psilocybe cubensis]|uniref:Uncharacterized protein n=2 Tax=Psilocybe cubensis TaxID=181762 RepID=A0ACB8GYB7_PSICU|nr:hypothetical protein JR316_0007345 [Psilocybe cubensis]KAH9480745.1 hypothetical protein JR316_0007345 [Psilocybe cubensis]
MDQSPSLSQKTYPQTVNPVTTQPTAGAARSFIHGVSMPANANNEHQPGSGASHIRGGGAAKDCCIGVLGAFSVVRFGDG